MNLNDYFNPVSLDKPVNNQLAEKSIFCRNISIHTANTPIGSLAAFDIALLGLPETGNGNVPNPFLATDRIRTCLYQLFRVHPKNRIIDLGNIKPGNTKQDAYYALRDVTTELFENGLIIICLGGSQDLTFGTYLAFEAGKIPFNLVTIDTRLDMGIIGDDIRAESFLVPILSRNKELLLSYTNLGHQKYFIDQQDLDFLDKHFHQSVRLGDIKSDITEVEPYLRDADLISIDMNAVKQSDAPGASNPSPNGFFSDEICQISRYAGLGKNCKSIGIHNIDSTSDPRDHTSHLAAQMVWYFIEGVSQRIREIPVPESKDYLKFIVNMSHLGQDIAFYKSLQTERWWFEVPVVTASGNQPSCRIISCSHEDYNRACNQEIPDRWWKAYKKNN